MGEGDRDGGGEGAEAAVRSLLAWIGEDPDRPGLLATPGRVAASLRELTRGYRSDPVGILRPGTVASGEDGPVVVRDLGFHSLCEHHLLPFFGEVRLAYLPQGRLAGLSKLARAVDAVSQRLQLQERLTGEIASAVHAALAPRGVLVEVAARHLCMAMRGARKPGHRVVTSCALGLFRDDPGAGAEAARLLASRWG